MINRLSQEVWHCGRTHTDGHFGLLVFGFAKRPAEKDWLVQGNMLPGLNSLLLKALMSHMWAD